jgi:hypothetical protein
VQRSRCLRQAITPPDDETFAALSEGRNGILLELKEYCERAARSMKRKPVSRTRLLDIIALPFAPCLAAMGVFSQPGPPPAGAQR